MGWNGLERNKLDYILTDLLPVEVSELFSFSQLYAFLLEKDTQKVVDSLICETKQNKAKGKLAMFKDGWSTKPLKYRILKGNGTMREMSIIQPVSALNLFLFIECYQKEILNYFEKYHNFSIRYHKKSTDLFYKSKSGKITQYFQEQVSRVGRGAIQQAANYFKIVPFESINSFADSRIWRMCNFKYRYYAKLDYKSCFDSIYTHSFSWMIERNVVDAKDANNSHSFIFQSGNIHDLCDWMPFFHEYNIELDTTTECALIEKASKSNDPIIWANLLLYSQYYKPFFRELLGKIEAVVAKQLSKISDKDPMMQEEFWYVLIFHNCPYISAALRTKMSRLIQDIRLRAANKNSNPSNRVIQLICDFLERSSSSGNKPEESLFNWKGVKNFSAQITYRTYQRTVFKRYRKNTYGLYASID